MTLRPAKIFLAGIFCFGFAIACYAASDDANVELTTNNGTTQFGVQNNAAADIFMVNSAGVVQASSNTILPGTTFYQNGDAVVGVSAGHLGFYGAAPVSKAAATTDLKTSLGNLGLITTGGATPLNLNGGTLTAAALTGSGSAPTVIKGAGCNVTPTVAGTNTFGTVSCPASGAGTASATIATITQNVTAPTAWICALTPANANAVKLQTTTGVFISSSTTTTWSFATGTTATAAGTYIWNYNCGAY